jgi:hypothetical protein
MGGKRYDTRQSILLTRLLAGTEGTEEAVAPSEPGLARPRTIPVSPEVGAAESARRDLRRAARGVEDPQSAGR